MSWQDDALLIFRNLIWDNSDEYTYTDSRLEEVLMVAAKLILSEVRFSTTYVVDVNTYSISPDPSDDNDFIYFMTLKAACMVDRGNARIAAMRSGLSAKCGPVTMQTSGHMDAFISLINNGYCKTYEDAKFEFALGNTGHIKAILSPFINTSFDPLYGRQ